MREPLFLWVNIIVSVFPLDVEHPSVFLDDETTLNNIQLPDCEDFLLDSPALSPIVAPCEIKVEETSLPDFALPESRGPHLPVAERVDHNSWFDFGIIEMFYRLCRYILLEFQQYFGKPKNDEFSPIRQEQEQNTSENKGLLGSFPSRQFDYDSCLISLYSPEFISHSIQNAEETVMNYTSERTFLPSFTDPSNIDFPSQVFFASLHQTSDNIFDSTAIEEEHRLLSLLHRLSDPIHDAAELSTIGLPNLIHPAAEDYSFIKSMKARLGISGETISEIFFTDKMERERIQIPEETHFKYTKLKDLKSWIKSSDEVVPNLHESSTSRYDSFISSLRLLDVFEIEEKLYKHPFTQSKREEKEKECGEKDASFDKSLHLSKECTRRHGSSLGSESLSVGVFMVPASQHSLMFTAVQSFFGNIVRPKPINGTAQMSLYAQEYYWFDSPHLGSKSIERRRKYLLHIPEDRPMSIILTCPALFRK
ncbi:hypothetical protein XU18_5222 [Perkinsela sp. CCAP 1560/4]|nr:hypothetical protein XU18_5222 [Perkinsela sp. CCAP 1560/4]|eukprot:KNH00545.1 hypothetical protein XU18_5222 [Perkinsela sp. CCAP 1560/4]